MTVVGISLVKDEADIIERTIEHMLGQVDQVLVADNDSHDGTREILANMPIRLVDDLDPAHEQGRKLTALALSVEADWIVPFDADEFWYVPNGRRIADALEDCQLRIATARMMEYVATDTLWWRQREYNPLLKVACRPAPGMRLHEGAHSVDYDGEYPPTEMLLAIRHYPYRSVDQFVSKVRNGYRGRSLTNLDADQSVHFRELGALLHEEGESRLRDVFYERYYYPHPEEVPELVRDPWL